MFQFIIDFFFRTKLNFRDYMSLKEPATSLMENIVDLHNFLFYMILIILSLVLWLLTVIMDNFIIFNKLVFFTTGKKKIINSFFLFSYILKTAKIRLFKKAEALEGFWTLLPTLLLLIISIPSFWLLYLSEEGIDTMLTIKIIGFQWYWVFDFVDLKPCWYLKNELDMEEFMFESFLEPVVYLEKTDYRLLETDMNFIIPTAIHIRLMVTSMDTLHSFAIPSLGLKIDAVPGRLNTVEIFLFRMGSFYGQCSELCGVGHSFMPIKIYAISCINFYVGDFNTR